MKNDQDDVLYWSFLDLHFFPLKGLLCIARQHVFFCCCCFTSIELLVQ